MQIMTSFPETVYPSATSGITGVYAVIDGVVSILSAQTLYTLAGSTTGIASAGPEMSAAMQTVVFDFPVYIASANEWNVGNYAYSVVSDGTVTPSAIMGVVSTQAEAQRIKNLMQSEILLALTSGSKVVNTALNEMIYFKGTGLAYQDVLLRQQLKDANGQATSNNPTEVRYYQDNFTTFVQAEATSGSLSGLV